jgi:hypothetical protein
MQIRIGALALYNEILRPTPKRGLLTCWSFGEAACRAMLQEWDCVLPHRYACHPSLSSVVVLRRHHRTFG